MMAIFFSLSITLIKYVYTDDYSTVTSLVYLLIIQVAIEIFGQIIITMLEYYFGILLIR